ncbi:MAG: hypothetical protein R6V84_17840 [Desulfobacterales bacterium]
MVEPTALKLRYRSIEQFAGHYRQLRSGRVFIATEMPLPAETPLRLALVIPDSSHPLSLEMKVLESDDRKATAKMEKPCGMLLGVRGDLHAAIKDLEQQMRSVPALESLLNERGGPSAAPPPTPPHFATKLNYTRMLHSGLPTRVATASKSSPAREDPALSMEWIRSAVDQAEAAREAPQEGTPEPAARTKKELTPAERERIKPVGDFVMDLTKAMMRSGYYAADHPSAHTAKHGLYDALQRSLGESPEIVITHQQAREKSEILITGILDEPVNVRTVVGAGMAELFVPKLSECLNRKALVSVAIKRSITPAHFNGFIDVMSDPTADRGQNDKVGVMLTRTLLERGITEISCVFLDDIIVLEKNLPWRVEMAIQRLAKDLKVLPMFQAESDDGIKRLKMQIIQDILRPLKHPEFLKDLIVNCYVIAQHVKAIREEDIEKVIIEAFPLDALLPTSHFIFAELNRLRAIGAGDPENPFVKRRFAGVKRILKWVSRRVVLADIRGAQGFLESLYTQGVLAFEELPPDVQYFVNTQRMAADVAAHIRNYAQRLLRPSSPGDAAALLKCFRRVIPGFLDQGDFQAVLWVARAAKKAAAEGALTGATPDPGGDPLRFLFEGRSGEILIAFERAEEKERQVLEGTLSLLGPMGIEALCRVLSDSQKRSARKAAMDALGRTGPLAREWVVSVLEDPTQKWFLKRNALMLLRNVAAGAADIEIVRPLLNHIHARVRNEALDTLIALKAPEAEALSVKALDDPDERIRWRAANALAELSPLSPATMGRLLSSMRSEPPAEKGLAERHYRKVAQIIKTVGGMKRLREPAQVEQALLEIAENATGQKKTILGRLRRSEEPDGSAVLGAAIGALGALGSQRAEEFLNRFADGKSPHASAARKALDALHTRLQSA